MIGKKILAIERELDLNGFTYRGENIWPIIRMAIYLSAKKPQGFNKARIPKMLVFFIAGCSEFLKQRILKSKKKEVVLVTSSHYKVKEGASTFDRVLSPVIDYLKSKNSISVWEFTSKYGYDNNLSYIGFVRTIQREIYFLLQVRKLFLLKRRKTTFSGDIEKLNSLLKEYDIKFRFDESFINKLSLIFFQADYFQKQLKRLRAKKVFLVCYYDVKCFSVLLAANRLGIYSMDLQHGVQGKYHMAYASWPSDIIKDNKFLPTHFYVWDNFSYETILAWKPEKLNVLKGSNKWFLDRAKKTGNDIILVSMQRREDVIPSCLIDIIKNYSGDKRWYVRLHPRQIDELKMIEGKFASEGLMSKIELRKATELPLTSLLERTCMHVTFYSSVAIEASYYNIPTYFLDEERMIHYSPYLNEEMVFSYPKHDFNSVIDLVLKKQSIAPAKFEDRISILDTFVNGK
ncbi:hypothetical protein LVD17_25505 [Fulvivirga ulvae]|uniref:hypothetical protein n=1 Tax=Fulvivirga ulvae TaxID=2904245 RepID=UPI001F2DDE15|nr:hypothetical protein [Fulvivirga ulvae]UII31652.1 hypothetical protein LVD17_25505 [Fulvivirga ulvae]